MCVCVYGGGGYTDIMGEGQSKEGTGSAKALRLKHVWNFQGTSVGQ